MTEIHARAFHNLKLIVELDFSWNKLAYIPLPQIAHLTLLRRLSMRGNPLQVIDDLTLSGGNGTSSPESQAESQAKTTTTADIGNEISIEEETGGSGAKNSDNEQAAKFKTSVSRLFETYPELVKVLIGPQLGGQAEVEELWNFLLDEFEDLRAQYETNQSGVNLLLNEDQLLATSQSLSTTTISSPFGGDDLAEPRGSSSGASQSIYGDELDSRSDLASAESKDNVHSLGRLKQLQELDLGECQISYIKWDTFKHLNSLKRLQLDGNRLR